MIEALVKKLRCRRGISTAVVGIFLFFIVFLVLVCLIEAWRVYQISISVRNAVESAVITTAASNAYNTYDGVREGNSGPYETDGGGQWNTVVSTSDVVYKLRKLLNLTYQSGVYKKQQEEERYEFSLSDIRVKAEPTPLGDASTQSAYLTTLTLEVPLSFGFAQRVPPIEIDMKHQSIYTPKF